MASLTTLNYVNVVAFVANVVVTYGLGTLGWFGTATNAEISEKYQSLITPAGYAFAIWGVIFISQFIWVILQLINTFSANPLVKDGVGWNYVLVVIAQCAWTIVFGFEWIILSVVAMLAILFFLVRIVRAQHRIEPNADYKDFILLKFPFDIHCGWIFAAKLVNANVLFVDLGLNSTIQFYSALASLLILILIALFFGFSHMNMVIPLVLAWASFGIYNELKNPKQLVSETFTENQITYTQYGSLAAASIASLVVVYVGVKLLMAWWKNRSDSQNTGSVNKKTADQTASETDYVRADYEMSGTKA